MPYGYFVIYCEACGGIITRFKCRGEDSEVRGGTCESCSEKETMNHNLEVAL